MSHLQPFQSPPSPCNCSHILTVQIQILQGVYRAQCPPRLPVVPLAEFNRSHLDVCPAAYRRSSPPRRTYSSSARDASLQQCPARPDPATRCSRQRVEADPRSARTTSHDDTRGCWRGPGHQLSAQRQANVDHAGHICRPAAPCHLRHWRALVSPGSHACSSRCTRT